LAVYHTMVFVFLIAFAYFPKQRNALQEVQCNKYKYLL